MRKYLYLLVIMGLSSLALAQNVRQDNIAFSRSGFPAPGALVAVCLQPATAGSTSLTACAPLAPLCSSSTDAICSSPNPVTADGLGNYHFYVKPGTYAIQIYGSGLTLALLRDQTVGGSSGGSAGAATTEALANCSATGTILNEGVELSSQVISGVLTACGTVASASSTSVIGICSSGCGITGSAQIAYQAFQSAIFDNQTVIGDVAAPSSSPGQFTDIGSVRVPGVESVGRIASINSGAGTTATINMFTGDMTASGASNGSGNVSQCNTSGGVSFYSAIGTIVVCDPSATLDGNGKLTAKQVVVAGTGPGTVTLQTGTAPANPAAGNGLLYVDSGTGFLSCLNSAGGSCNPLTGSLAFSAITTGTNAAAAMHVGTGASLNATGSGTIAATSTPFSGVTASTNSTAAMLVGTGASLLPNAQGQISGITDWFSPYPTVTYPSQPTLTGALTGGALATGTTMFVKLTFVGAATIAPSAEVRINLNAATNCASGSACTVTVNMPSECTAPSAPVTGCTVWDVTSAGNIGLEKQQTASAACVNITSATCVIGTAATGALLTNLVTTGTNPPNLQAVANTPDNIVPSLFIKKGDNNFYPIAGVDISALNALPQPAGTFTFFDRFFVNDTNGTPIISNALVSIHHMSGNSTSTGVGVDDRAIGIEMVDSTTATPTYQQSLTQYNERIISNNNFLCAPVGNGAVGESCDAAGRFITSDTRSAAANNVTLEALAGVASYAHASGGLGSCNPCVIGVKGGAFEATNSANPGSAIFAGGFFGANGSTSNSNGTGIGVYVPTPAVRFATQNVGFRSQTQGTNGADWDVLMDGDGNTGGRSMFQGNVYLPHIVPDNGTMPVDGSVSVTGGVSTAQNSAPGFSGVTNFGTAGAATDVYKGTCVDVNGAETVASASAQTTTANADLTAVHGNNINILTQVGCSSYNIYRTSAASTCNGGACTNGKIGNIVPGLMTSASNNTVTFQDTGQVGDGNTAVAQANTTGGEVIAGIVRWGNTQRRAASDFTTSSGTLVTLFSWNLPITTTNYSFRCDLVYSQQTAAAGLLLGIQSATTSPTSMMASARIYSTVTGTSTDATSVITNTTATTVLTGAAPAAINTNYQASLYGSIENVGANVLNVMVATANVADQITILRGSACHLF